LFPLSYERMEDYVHQHWLVDQDVAGVKASRSESEVVELLRQWIREDRKEKALKSIQGKIWKEAFESGAIRGHVYPDVRPCFVKWMDMGIKNCIYSSGSVQAQTLLFRYSEAGDLTPFLSDYFDTTSGPKKEPASYQRIARSLLIAPERILFLSDVAAELDAARI